MTDTQGLLLVGWAGVLGLIVGSFLNVCIFRLPRNCMSIVRPRSRCPKCRAFIAWYDNLPVASWIVLGGRCRHCRNPVSPRYALVEILTGALYGFAAWRALVDAKLSPADASPVFAVQAWFIGSLVVCAFIDLDFRILPDEVTKPGIAIGLLASFLVPFQLLHGDVSDVFSVGHFIAHRTGLAGPDAPERGIFCAAGRGLRAVLRFNREHPHLGSLAASAAGAVTGFVTIWTVGVMGKVLFRKKIARLGETEAMGFGDVKYMAMLGAVLGWKGVLLTLVLACFVGAIFGLVKLAVLRRMGYAPFGPFLSIGALAMLLWPGGVHGMIQLYLDLTHRVGRWLFPS